MKRTPLFLLLLVGLLLPHQASAVERAQAGFIFVSSTTPAIREKPAADAKIVGKPAPGARLIYRRVDETDGRLNEIVWYRVEPAGGTPGWISAKDASTTLANKPQQGTPVKLVDSGLGNVKASASATAAARGMDARAIRVGEKQDLKVTVDQFLTLEELIEHQFDDPHANDSSYPESGPKLAPLTQTRKEHAAAFRKEAK